MRSFTGNSGMKSKNPIFSNFESESLHTEEDSFNNKQNSPDLNNHSKISRSSTLKDN
jgi:hypothetical protein